MVSPEEGRGKGRGRSGEFEMVGGIDSSLRGCRLGTAFSKGFYNGT